jgi:hypothetical protein
MSDHGTFGPAMRVLNPRMRAFVTAWIETGIENWTELARLAGYEGDRLTLKSTGYRVAHDPRVIAALKEEGQRVLDAGSIIAIKTLTHLSRTAAKDSDKIKAADMILNRTGFSATTEHKVTVEHITPQEKMREIERLAALFSIPIEQLRGMSAPALALPAPIDAEYVEVTEEKEPWETEYEAQSQPSS